MQAAHSMDHPAPAVAALFDPVTLGALELRNRLVMAPMTRAFSPGGIPESDVADYDRRRAVAIGRALSMNPDWPKVVATGGVETLKPFSVGALAGLS